MNGFVNFDDVLLQLANAGLQVDVGRLSTDGKIQRWKTTDSKGGEKPGWSRLREWQSKAGHLYVVGSFGVWRGNEDGYTKIDLPKRDDPSRPVLSAEDIEAAKAAQKLEAKARAERLKAEQKIAAGWAGQVWAASAPATGHEYLTRKGVGPHVARVFNGLPDEVRLPGIDDANKWRLSKSVGALVVPMHDVDGNVCGLQFIFPRGHEFEGKQFWPTGMGMGGTFGVIGGLRRSGVLLVTEGFATAATLHEATGQPVAYAFSANNLGKAGKQIRARYKLLRILFCADDDYLAEAKTGNNPGVASAQLAASEIEHAAWVKPDFADEAGADRRDGKKLSDFNDLAALVGFLPLVIANQINAKLDALGWRDSSTLGGAGFNDQGGGEGGRPKARAVMSLDEIVERFRPIDDGTGEVVFDTWTNKIARHKQMITLLPAGVRGDDLKRHPVWVDRGACYLDQVGFDPTQQDKAVLLNTWQGWPLTPKAGKCDLIKEHLQYLCSNEGPEKMLEVVHWLTCWMAWPLQNPGAKMASAVIMHGPQGTGKSAIFQTLAKIYGDYSTVLNQRGLEDKFNADWADSKLFILAEEVVTRAEMWHIKNELKELVTGTRVRVNPKNVGAYYQKNQINFVYLSNEGQPLPLENDDRRHLVVWNPPACGEDYYDDLWQEIDNGGVEAFYDYLLNYDTSGFHPKKRPPMTEAKQDLIALSSPSEFRFLTEWITGRLDLPVCPALASDVYAAYLRWCRVNGESRPRASNQFHGIVHRMQGWAKKDAQVYLREGDPKTCTKALVFPPDAAIARDGREMPAGGRVGAWLGESLRAFAAAGETEQGVRAA